MKRLICLIAMVAAMAAPAHADFGYHFSTPGVLDATADGLQGLHLGRASTDVFPVGVSWDVDGQFAWASGLDCTMDYSYPGVSPTPPDLVLAYSSITHSDNLRLRADDARMVLGPRIGHPVMPFQLELDAGTSAAPLGGLFVSTEGNPFGLYMENRAPGTKRNTISLQNLFCLQTDTQQNGTGDVWFYNFQSASPVFSVTPANAFTLDSPHEGFYGAPPVGRPEVSGSFSDGSAQRSLLAALVKLGLVADGTTP